MGTINSCQPEFDIKNTIKEIKSTTNYFLKNKKHINSDNNSHLIRKRMNKSKEENIKNKPFLKNEKNNSRVKNSSKVLKTKFIESSILYQKNSSNKIITNSLNSIATNNNSKNIINNKRINTIDNTKNLTGSEEDTIVNQNSIDYLNNFDVKNFKYNKMLNLKQKYFENNNNKKKCSNTKNQIINIINEENEDLNLSKIYDPKNKSKRNKRLLIFSSESQPFLSQNSQSTYYNDNKSMKYNRSKINKKFSSNFSPKTANINYQNNQNKIYKKSSCFNLKTNLISTKAFHQSKSIYKKIKKNKKTIKLNLDEKDINEKEIFNHHIFFSEISPLYKCPSYKNENNLLKNLEKTRKKQEKEITLLKQKVNNLCNIIEDNKNFKEKEIIQKDKLISYLQKEKIKNENIIKKLKTQLKKEKIKSYNDKNDKNIINKNIYKNYTKINKFSTNNINNYNLNVKERNIKFKSEYFSDIKNKTEIFKHIIYEKKNHKSSDNTKKKILRKSIPIKVNIDLTNPINNPLMQYKNDNYEKNKFFTKEISNYSNKILNNNEKEVENIYYNRFIRNKSDFAEKFKGLNIKNSNENLNNIIYVPKKSKLSQKFFLSKTNKDERNKKKSNNNSLSIINKNKEIKNENKEIQNDIIKETLSLTGTNYLNESLNNIEDITMNLNLTPIVKNYSKNIIQSIEDFSLFDLFEVKNNSIKKYNSTQKQNFIYKNKLKLDVIDIIHRNKKYSLSPKTYRTNKHNKQNYYYARDYLNIWNIFFNIFDKDINIKINKNTLLSQSFQSLIDKIKSNKELSEKINFILENKDKIIFESNNIILDINKSLEENKLNNFSKINIVISK